MANHADAIKRHKQNISRRARNRNYRTQLRNHTKRFRSAVDEGDLDLAREELKSATSMIHRVASKGIIHRNQAARRVARLAAAVKKLEASQA